MYLAINYQGHGDSCGPLSTRSLIALTPVLYQFQCNYFAATDDTVEDAEENVDENVDENVEENAGGGDILAPVCLFATINNECTNLVNAMTCLFISVNYLKIDVKCHNK